MVFPSFVGRSALSLLVFGVALAQAGHAQPAAIAERYPSGSIHSEERADQALKDVEEERRRLDAGYAASERVCYERFFATDCLQKAKDERRDALARIRPIEIEANTFKRRARVEERERAAAERAAKREAQANERLLAKQASEEPAADGGSGNGRSGEAGAVSGQRKSSAAQARKRDPNGRAGEKKQPAVESQRRTAVEPRPKTENGQTCGSGCDKNTPSEK
ncbi:MAG TPA: hypothetical protein VEC06_16935 [Paucimonas sp.]|nr:hypothetical protein [Paucimonas sp.]